MENEIEELYNNITKKSLIESDFFPIDRFFLERNGLIEKILKVDKKEFALYSFEQINPNYSFHLMLCLPDLWKYISVDDICEMLGKFTNLFSFLSFIEFTYKIVEVNMLSIIFGSQNVKEDMKYEIQKVLLDNFYPNLLKNDSERFFFENNVYGVSLNQWVSIKKKYLCDSRVSEILTSLSLLQKYIREIWG
ncbi:MAG: hypothetical protein BGO09_05495 [Bacteroidetes bacterium 47-18]|nr:MAG: hypothetical protein BGO09_05495 [Bacteroidetes bacterium 47-18]